VFKNELIELTVFKQLQRQVKLYEISLSIVEEENKELKKEIQEIKKFIYKKQ